MFKQKEIKRARQLLLSEKINRNDLIQVAQTLINKKIYTKEIEPLFLLVIHEDLIITDQVTDYVLKILNETDRLDDFTAEFCLTACYRYRFENDLLITLLDKVAIDFMALGRTDDLANEIYDLVQSMPDNKEIFIEDINIENLDDREPYGSKGFHRKCVEYIKTYSITTNKVSLVKLFKINKIKLIFNYPVQCNALYVAIGIVILLIPVTFLINNSRAKSESTFIPSAHSKKFTIQVAAFKSLDDAFLFMKKIVSHGEFPQWIESQGKTHSWVKIRLGKFNSTDEAKNYAKKLIKQKIINDYFVANYENAILFEPLENKGD